MYPNSIYFDAQSIYYLGTWTLRVKRPKRRDVVCEGFGVLELRRSAGRLTVCSMVCSFCTDIWVVVKIRVPFWVP